MSDNKIDEKGVLWITETQVHENGPPLVRLEITAITDSVWVRTLTYLDINDNECGEKTAVEMGKYVSTVIFKGLPENQSLKYLNLSWNDLDTNTYNELGEARKEQVFPIYS